jgi:hypothetical protein
LEAVLDAELDKVVAPLRSASSTDDREDGNQLLRDDSIGRVVDSTEAPPSGVIRNNRFANNYKEASSDADLASHREDDDSGIFDFKRSLYGYAVNSVMWIIASA